MKFKKAELVRIAILLACTLLSGCGDRSVPSTPPTAPPEQSAAQQGETGGNSYGKYLTAAEIKGLTGLSGLTVKEENMALQFIDSSGSIVYEAKFYSSSSFYEEEVEGNRKYYTDVPGVGDKAAIGIPDSPYRLTFVKGEQSVMTQVLARDSEGKWLLDEEQLISLAKAIASKM